MIKTIIGLILLLMPFLLVNNFKNKKLGFFYVLSFLLGFHLAAAVLTQLFHVFSYGILLGINGVIGIVILIKTNFKELIKNICKIKIDWILIFVIVILVILLFSVHYNYTGKINVATDTQYREVKHMKYAYPYFSDEWSAVSLVKYSIKSKSLPLANPLWYNFNFPNLELPFHSFISGIILLLNLDPLTQYTLLTIFSGMIICLLVYFILRLNKAGRFSSAIACLSVPYIVNGANLPGIWNLIAFTMGIITILLGFLFMSIDDRKMILFMAFLTLIFYPPLFALYSVSLILYFIFADIPKKEKIRVVSYCLIACVFAAVLAFIFVLIAFPFNEGLSYIFSKIFYTSLTENAIPDFAIWKILPAPILLIFAFGAFRLIRKKEKIWLIAPVFVGLIYWAVYSFVLWRFIIDYARVVVLTSILITLTAGFGADYLIRYVRKIDFINRYKVLGILETLILILFLALSFFYTQRDNWQELKLYTVEGNQIDPASPANNYLHPDDLKLFEGIKERRFLSIPWKGTVIGVATDNYPIRIKASTITNEGKGVTDSISLMIDFINGDCSEKSKIVEARGTDYVYSPEFDCPGFELIGTSNEGLHLYKVLND